MIKYKDKQVMTVKDVDANTVIVQHLDGKEEVVQRADLVDDGVSLMVKGPGDRLPPVVRTIPGKEINIHIPDKDVEIYPTKEQLEASKKSQEAADKEAEKTMTPEQKKVRDDQRKTQVEADKARDAAHKAAADKGARDAKPKTSWL